MTSCKDLSHCLTALRRVEEHGGSFSTQLDDVAESLESSNNWRIVAALKKMEIKSMGPLALVFTGFMLIIFLQLSARAGHALGGTFNAGL